MTSRAINIVFAREWFSPDLTFVEIEDDDGASIRIGEWSHRPAGVHVLRIDVEAGDDK